MSSGIFASFTDEYVFFPTYTYVELIKIIKGNVMGYGSENLTKLIGAKILDIELNNEYVIIKTDKATLKMYHQQDCCESVYLEDICGAPEDCIGETIVLFEERSSDTTGKPEKDTSDYESCTWTFYELRTTGGDMNFRWLGSSNGYYSESVDCVLLEENKT